MNNDISTLMEIRDRFDEAIYARSGQIVISFSREDADIIRELIQDRIDDRKVINIRTYTSPLPDSRA